MPYIPQAKRQYFDAIMAPDLDITQPGSLNYAFTKMLCAYAERKGGWTEAVLNELYGVLWCCLLELHRRKGKQVEKVLDINVTPSYTAYNNYLGNNLRIRLEHMFDLSDLTLLVTYYNDIVADYEDKKIKENGDVYRQ